MTVKEQKEVAWTWFENPSLQLIYKDFREYVESVEKAKRNTKNAK